MTTKPVNGEIINCYKRYVTGHLATVTLFQSALIGFVGHGLSATARGGSSIVVLRTKLEICAVAEASASFQWPWGDANDG